MAIVQLYVAMNALVTQLVSNAQVRPLNDGKILLGREHATDTRAPNSIVMVPVTTRFGRSQITSTTDTVSPTEGRIARLRARTIASRLHVFEVHVWGAATPGSPYDDYEVTEFLFETVIRAAYAIATVDAQWTDGTWMDQQPDAFQRDKVGHYFVFHLGFDGPIADLAVNLAPHGTTLEPTLNVNPVRS